MLGSTWWSCCSSHKNAPIRSSQLRRGRTVHLAFSSSTATQLPSYIHVPSWSENWAVYQNVSLAPSWLFLAVRAGKQLFEPSSSLTFPHLSWSAHDILHWLASSIMEPVQLYMTISSGPLNCILTHFIIHPHVHNFSSDVELIMVSIDIIFTTILIDVDCLP